MHLKNTGGPVNPSSVNKDELRQRLYVAIQAARKGRQVLNEYFGKLERVEKKYMAGLVSEADKESERVIQEHLLKNFPEDIFLGEESYTDQTLVEQDPRPRWIVDPLDGTTNYIHRFPIYCVSIGLQIGQQNMVAVIDVPQFQEVYTAIKGQGSFMNGKKIEVSQAIHLKESLLATGFFGEDPTILQQQMEIFAKVIRQSRGIRRPGAAAYDLCMVARGSLDAFWEQNLKAWDTCAGQLLVEEAGGRCTTYQGDAYTPFRKTLVASNGKIHEELLSMIQK